jgi:predicted acetyltransferase
MHLTMFARGGAPLPCHGVAFVGAIRTERRKAKADGDGVATAVMKATVARGRDRGDVVSALMPFRASYYEHFGYGLVERRAVWSIPTSVLPSGDAGDWRHFEPAHLPGMLATKAVIARAGNCDIERPEATFRQMTEGENNTGWMFTLLDGSGGGVGGWCWAEVESEAGVMCLRVVEWGVQGATQFVQMLRLLGSMKDQYAKVTLRCPADWQLGRVLRESQVPHRPVAHGTAQMSVHTRMQVRILDHKRYLEALAWAPESKGSAVIAVKECEGHESRFRVTVEGGRASVSPSAETPQLTLRDVEWASVATGELAVSEALRWGLASGSAPLLEALAWGPKPYTFEYF